MKKNKSSKEYCKITNSYELAFCYLEKGIKLLLLEIEDIKK